MSIILSEHFSDFFGETEHFSGKTGALRWSILVGKQKHNVQSLPSSDRQRLRCVKVSRSFAHASVPYRHIIFSFQAFFSEMV